MLLSFVSLILDAGVIPPGNNAYPYFAAVQNGLTSALCTCLLINGFVGFQLYEDGTTFSVWLLRTISFAMFIITGLVSLATFKGWAGLGPTHTIGLFVVLYLVSGVELLIYFIMQIILVVNTLQDRWPLGDLAFGGFFFVVGQVILYVFSNTICNAVQHYLDGLFFATMCNLLAVMMVYKVCYPLLIFQPEDDLADLLNSIGTPSREKISNFLWARSKTTGRSRSSCQRTSVETQFTKIQNTRARCTTTPTKQGTRITEALRTRILPFWIKLGQKNWMFALHSAVSVLILDGVRLDEWLYIIESMDWERAFELRTQACR